MRNNYFRNLKKASVNFYAPDSVRPNQLSNLLSMPFNWSNSHTTYWQHGDHLGSAAWVTDTNGTAWQHLQYMPWGEPFVDLRNENDGYETRYTFSGKERDEETGFSYFGARHYNPSLSIWLSVDPMADKYPGLSPYTYCANNPVKLVDPNGREISPIYDTQGCFLGTDDEGLTGKAIVMKKEDFKQGMSHKEALSKSLGQEGLVDDDAYDKLSNHYSQLKNRPDYDGIITDAEARSWWENGNGQSLFVKQSMIDLSPVTTQDFKDNSKITHNFFFDATSNKDVGRVYGTLTLSLIDAKTGEVKLGNPNNAYIDTYDFNSGGSVPRNIATWTARKLIGKGTPFSIYGWGRNPTVKVKN